MIFIIVAVEKNNGIGLKNHLPWKLPKEMKYFSDTTKKTEDPAKQNMVIMGRSTWEALGPKYQPLPERRNVVLTRQDDYQAEGAEICHSLDEAINKADQSTEKIFIIGGGKVFEEAINHPKLAGIYLTRLAKEFECDTFFPEIPERFSNQEKLGSDSEDGINFDYFLYT